MGLVTDRMFLVNVLREAGEGAVAVNGDEFVLDVGPATDSFIRPVRDYHHRHGVARVMESSARDREDWRDLTGYALARATVISGDGKVRG